MQLQYAQLCTAGNEEENIQLTSHRDENTNLMNN